MSRSKTTASASDLEAYLTDHILAYSERQHEFWKRRYDSEAVFLESVAGARRCWEQVIAPIQTFDPEPLCVVQQMRNNEWFVELRQDDRVLIQARLLVPATNGTPPPLAVCLHGIGGSAAMVLGEDDTHPPAYHAFGRALLDKGCAVLVPSLINAFAPRGRVNRLALLLGSSIWGIELAFLRRMLDECLARFPLDSERIAVWGLSMGGAYTMFWMPLDMRLQVGIVSGWFNHRRLKMAVPDPAYTCFLETEEEHAFLPGWLSHFSDSDLVSLICPRPLLIQTGRTDSVSDPDRVRQEWSAAHEHYQLLQRAERLRWDLHDGGHCVHLQTGIDFVQRYLLAADARANGISASTSVD